MTNRIVGYVLWWNDEIGYGRVKGQDGHEYHIHHKQFMDRATSRIKCEPNQCVSFCVGLDNSKVPPRVRAEMIEFADGE